MQMLPYLRIMVGFLSVYARQLVELLTFTCDLLLRQAVIHGKSFPLTSDSQVPLCGLLCPGLVHEECITKMRLMSLAGLASKGSGEISYSVVRDTLKVNFLFQCYRLLWMLHVAFFY